MITVRCDADRLFRSIKYDDDNDGEQNVNG